MPELLGGRVKTLHPRIHAGILARRGREVDLDELREQGIRTFDLVCVNLYPFQSVTARRNVREEDAVEMIDIGGPALLRAAAKNFVDVVPVCEPERVRRDPRPAPQRAASTWTPAASSRPRRSRTRRPTRRRSRRGSRTSRRSRRSSLLSLERVDELVYGENPHQRAAYYAEAGVRRHLLSRVEQLGGRELSFNNLNDLDAARAARARVHAAALRHRQAREPLRLRRGGDDRRGVRKGARLRPGLRVRRRRRAQPAGFRRARRAARRAVRRGADRARVRRGGARPRSPPRSRCGSCATASGAGDARRARLSARARRLARPGRGQRGRRPRGDGRRDRAAPGRGRPGATSSSPGAWPSTSPRTRS